jgi:hypothetical protein
MNMYKECLMGGREKYGGKLGRPQVEDIALCMYQLVEAGGWWEMLRSFITVSVSNVVNCSSMETLWY